ncbi:hypothetical protein ACFOUP_16845 [Belliella kenyensis]|uniref:Uncharacterized protein n=1 Tax=Belliella kenyensis TaxID=1472724 RepID=A0ABV8EPS4_9BACT|nr:hypothetical protein [Belliella kenyensis]MCH7402883.1 hypothetical protein [Belliella kenyensis]MDN3602589.1 hypothetical protein [Belliella kenyensis]
MQKNKEGLPEYNSDQKFSFSKIRLAEKVKGMPVLPISRQVQSGRMKDVCLYFE